MPMAPWVSAMTAVGAVLLASLSCAQCQGLTRIFSVNPDSSNLTLQLSPVPDNAYASIAFQPLSFPLSGFVTVRVTACSPDRFSNNVSQAEMVGSWLYPSAAQVEPRMSVTSVSVGNVTALLPSISLATPPFVVEPRYGEFTSYWVAPIVTWQNVSGYIPSGGGFIGGPVADSNVTSQMGSFAGLSGFLTATNASGSSLHMFINSSVLLDARQLLLSLNASGSLLNRVLGANQATSLGRIVLSASASNPCGVIPLSP